MSKRKKDLYVPYEKSSKQRKREIDRMRRNDWGDVNPVTRKEEKNSYKRKKQKEREDSLWD